MAALTGRSTHAIRISRSELANGQPQTICNLHRYLMPYLVPYGGVSWTLSCLLPPSSISLFASVLLKMEVHPATTYRRVTFILSMVDGGMPAAALPLSCCLPPCCWPPCWRPWPLRSIISEVQGVSGLGLISACGCKGHCSTWIAAMTRLCAPMSGPAIACSLA